MDRLNNLVPKNNTMSFLQKWGQLILILGLAVGLVVALSTRNPEPAAIIEDYVLRSEIELYEDTIQQERDWRIKLEDREVLLLDSIDYLNTISVANEQKLAQNEKKLNEALNTIDSYSTNDINSYLSERYK